MDTAKGKTGDQRCFRRYAVSFACLVRPQTRKATLRTELQVETQDLSSGGLFFVASADWRPGTGTKIECELLLPAMAFAARPVGIRCHGKVARLVPQEDGLTGVGATIDHYEFFHLEKSASG